jgi:hypothetical protein
MGQPENGLDLGLPGWAQMRGWADHRVRWFSLGVALRASGCVGPAAAESLFECDGRRTVFVPTRDLRGQLLLIAM